MTKRFAHKSRNTVPFFSVENMMKLVSAVGIERFMVELDEVIAEDFRRWRMFDESSRVAAHSNDGVIELMPTSNGRT